LPYVTMILDEGAALPSAAAKARTNARAGTRRFRFLSLANPTNVYDEASRFCEPTGGWGLLDEFSESWRSSYGLVLHNHGASSPEVQEPGKYPYLIGQGQLDDMLKDCGGNTDDALYWTMVKGLPRPGGASDGVLSHGDLQLCRNLHGKYRAAKFVVRVGGLDPSFSSGGDGCIFSAWDLLAAEDGTGVLCHHATERIPLNESEAHLTPMSYQAVYGGKRLCEKYGISFTDIGIDDSGTQSVADIWEVETGFAPLRENFGAGAREWHGGAVVLNANGKNPGGFGGDGWKRCADRVTELWDNVARSLRSGRVLLGPDGKLLGEKAEKQFVNRLFVSGAVPLKLEKKKDYKRRNGGNSPDEADAVALAQSVAFERFGYRPDGGQVRVHGRKVNTNVGVGYAQTKGYGAKMNRPGPAASMNFKGGSKPLKTSYK